MLRAAGGKWSKPPLKRGCAPELVATLLDCGWLIGRVCEANGAAVAAHDVASPCSSQLQLIVELGWPVLRCFVENVHSVLPHYTLCQVESAIEG
jgi:hypothetical protein